MISVYEKVKEFQNKFPGSVSWRLKKHSKILDMHINPGENILFAFAAQKNNNFYDIFSTYIFCLTDKRILIARKRLVFGYFLISITPDLFNDLKINRGLFWGKVIIDTVKEEVTFSNVCKSGLNEIETNVSEFMMKEKKKYGLNYVRD